MTNKLARGFDTVLLRYLPQLLCFEVKPSYMYARGDYMRLLVNSSVLNAYAEGMMTQHRKRSAPRVELGRARTGRAARGIRGKGKCR